MANPHPNRRLHVDCLKQRNTTSQPTYNRRARVKAKKDGRAQGWDLVRAYNLTREQYNEMLSRQGEVCAICGGTNPDGTALQVDHDNTCCLRGRTSATRRKTCGLCTRELLCGPCNRGLGSFKDAPELLRAAANYLEKHMNGRN